MRTVIAMVSLLVLLPIPVLAVAQTPACAACKLRGVPGPIAGAGLPIIAAGYGVYWLTRRPRPRARIIHTETPSAAANPVEANVHESTVWRLADRLGYRVEKYGPQTIRPNNNCQYQLIDVLGNYVVLGANYDATLADIEDWLCEEAYEDEIEDACTSGDALAP